MADAPKPNPPTEDDMHWGISYLREDLQELRLGQRSLQDRMDRLAEASSARVEAVNDSLSGRMDAMNESLTSRMDAMNQNLTSRMDAMNQNLTSRMDAMNESLTKRIDSRFAVLLTAMIGLIGISIGANFAFLRMYLPAP